MAPPLRSRGFRAPPGPFSPVRTPLVHVVEVEPPLSPPSAPTSAPVGFAPARALELFRFLSRSRREATRPAPEDLSGAREPPACRATRRTRAARRRAQRGDPRPPIHPAPGAAP